VPAIFARLRLGPDHAHRQELLGRRLAAPEGHERPDEPADEEQHHEEEHLDDQSGEPLRV